MTNDDRTGLLANPLPIVMVVLVAAGVLVKTVPLQTARPANPERVTFETTGRQDVEARLWQDPFAAVERHRKLPGGSQPATPHVASRLHGEILRCRDGHRLIFLAVTVPGGSFAEAAESRRRTRFALISALGFHDYNPRNGEAIGYFVDDAYKLTVPFEWFTKRGESSHVLVLWLNEDKLTSTPLATLEHLTSTLVPAAFGRPPDVKLIGPAASAMLIDLSSELRNRASQKAPPAPKAVMPIQVFAPGATISDCDLRAAGSAGGERPLWDCFNRSPVPAGGPEALPIIRTTGTDDVLAAALLWELWQRGLKNCEDGLVLIGERDTAYGRTLLGYLKDGFTSRCGTAAPTPVRVFTYLRGLDGVLPDIDKSDSGAPRKADDGQTKDLNAQIKDSPPEHAEGRSQFDYLRRLADEIARLDRDGTSFAKNGVAAIGIVGSDVYDKLLILQALRSRFKDKIFFTTDLDARYLHADQKEWARNLVVASNFGLSLRPALQQWTLPFRDTYQTATYLATLMALEDGPIDRWKRRMRLWLRPQLFEIGRTEAVYLASPSVARLRDWRRSGFSLDIAATPVDDRFDGDWTRCRDIEPSRPSRRLPFSHVKALLLAGSLGILSIALASRRAREAVRATYDALTRPGHPDRRAARIAMIGVATLVVAALTTTWIVDRRMNASLDDGTAEPFVWFEGVSVWPSLGLRFLGLTITIGLVLAFVIWLRLQADQIAAHFGFSSTERRTLARSRWSALRTGPHLDLASLDENGRVIPKSAGASVEIVTLWQNYLRATHWREMAGWILASALLVLLLGSVAFRVFGAPSFPHRGDLVLHLHVTLLLLNVPVLWLVIFWVGYETRACARFIEALSDDRNVWPKDLLEREEARTRVSRAHLDDDLDFQLIVLATQRIRGLIYLPFVAILFMVLARSDLFDTMDFPLALAFVTGLALAYALQSVVLLRKSAETARTKVLGHYERQLLEEARPKESPSPSHGADAGSKPTGPPFSEKQIKLLTERIRNSKEGAFAPIAQQPALRALLLPFGGYGGIQLIEYLFRL
jgi:hypothetical protein